MASDVTLTRYDVTDLNNGVIPGFEVQDPPGWDDISLYYAKALQQMGWNESGQGSAPDAPEATNDDDPATGTPNVANTADNIYGSDGSKLLVALSPNGSGGYDGTFVVGLSGLPATSSGTGTGTTATANSVAAALSATKFRRTASNRRILRATSTVAEAVKVRARLSRDGVTIASKTVTGVTSGVRAIDLTVPRATAGGSARLTMTYTDGTGLTKTVRKTVTVPRKRLV